MILGDTIAAVATGWTRSPRGLVRLSGPDVPLICETLLTPPVPPPSGGGGTITPTRLPLGIAPLPCLAMRYAAPRSYTGQDMLELVVPGSPVLLERVLGVLCERPGVREAGPGEFSARAYLAGKLTLAEAEGVAATIAARTEAELIAATRLASGETGARYRAWADETTTLLALVEAGIDFTDQEDVIPIAPADLAARADALAAQIRETLGAVRGAERRGAEPRVVLAGAPNAGKSTLFNALLRRRRAVESPVAGTTRDVLEEPLELARDVPGAQAVRLIDLAGLDESARSGIDADAQRRARRTIDEADVVIHCDPGGRFAAPLPGDPSRPVIRVRTKGDLLALSASGGDLAVCALDGWNLDALRRAIADAAAANTGSSAWVLPRHRRALSEAAACLEDAASAAASKSGPCEAELIASALRGALDSLGELVGEVSPDDVIGRIFATFCVGK